MRPDPPVPGRRPDPPINDARAPWTIDVDETPGEAATTSWWRRLPRGGRQALLALVVLAVLGIAGVAWLATWTPMVKVHVVNGTGVPYDVEIAGRLLHLPAHDLDTLRVPQGEVLVRRLPCHRADAGTEETVTIEAGILDVLSSPVFVINPDRAAVLWWEQAGYYPDPSTVAVDVHAGDRVHVGQVLYSFRHIDDPFRELPESATSPGATGSRRRVDLVRVADPEEVFSLVEALVDRDAAIEQLVHATRLAPDDVARLYEMRDVLGRERLARELERWLAVAPAMVEVHRVWQSTFDDRAVLEAEYRGRLAAAPDDVGLRYLLLRTQPAGPQRDAAIAEIAAGADAPKEAVHSHLTTLTAQARFVEARAVADRYATLDGDSQHALWHQWEVATALGDDAAALEFARREAAMDEENPYRDTLVVTSLHRLGRHEEAEKRVEGIVKGLSVEGAPVEALGAVGSWFGAIRTRLEGRVAETMELLERVPSTSTEFFVHAMRGDMAALDAVRAEGDEVELDHLLMAAIAAAQAADRSADEPARASHPAIRPWIDAVLEHKDAQGALWEPHRRWIGGAQAPEVEEVLAEGGHGDTRCLTLVLVGMLHPTIREQLFQHAERVNVVPTLNQMFVQEAIRRAREGQAR